VIGVHDLCV